MNKEQYFKPWFANKLVVHYCNDTEPKLFPDAYTQYIELRAYEALQAENTKLLDKLANKHVTIHKENQALQAKLDKAVEALECCANDDRGHQSVAFEALQEITADQNKSGET